MPSVQQAKRQACTAAFSTHHWVTLLKYHVNWFQFFFFLKSVRFSAGRFRGKDIKNTPTWDILMVGFHSFLHRCFQKTYTCSSLSFWWHLLSAKRAFWAHLMKDREQDQTKSSAWDGGFWIANGAWTKRRMTLWNASPLHAIIQPFSPPS